jgi:low temperature requirement protein LtrA
MEAASSNATVTPLELFFDLVFVFALTQITALLADDLTWRGVLRAGLVLALLWWCWVGYAWVGNVVRADEGAVRVVMIAAMTAMFLVSLTIPEAFDDLPGGLSGPVVVAVCYFAVRLMHLSLFWVISADDPGLRRQLVRFTPSVIGGTSMLLVASQLDGVWQTAFWGLALAADYTGTLLAGASGWRVRSPGHFAERHGLILIVALGESIVAIGVGVAQLPISWPIVVASVTGLIVAASLWWTYFDTTSIKGERALAAEPEATRARLARDAYSYLHLPMAAGIVLLALGLKKVLEYVGDTEHHTLDDPLKGIALYALLGGVAMFLLTQGAFVWRMTRVLHLDRVVIATLLLAVIPLASKIPALATLVVLAVAMICMIAFEAWHYAELRREIRHAQHDHT